MTEQAKAELEERLAKIRRGVPRVEKEKSFDQKDLAEFVALEVARLETGLANEVLLLGLRKKYGNNIIAFLWVYFVFATLTLIAHGLRIGGFQLPELTLAAIVGATVVSVLGVVGTVAAGLFRPPN